MKAIPPSVSRFAMKHPAEMIHNIRANHLRGTLLPRTGPPRSGAFELRPLRPDDAEAVLAFELENRAYFATWITDRGDAFFQGFEEHHRALLAEQDAGICMFYVLVDGDGSAVVGRFNLYDLQDGAANVGYRVAERVAGAGVATRGLLELCHLAIERHGLRILTAEASQANRASQRVLEKAGFAPAGDCVVGGQPGQRFTLALGPEAG